MKRRRHKPQRPSTFGEPELDPFFNRSEPDVNVHLESRSCADCVAYAPIGTMITMPDGRVICKTCWRNLRKRSAKHAQPSMIEPAQSTLF